MTLNSSSNYGSEVLECKEIIRDTSSNHMSFDVVEQAFVEVGA
jgi:hypothetical protein